VTDNNNDNDDEHDYYDHDHDDDDYSVQIVMKKKSFCLMVEASDNGYVLHKTYTCHTVQCCACRLNSSFCLKRYCRTYSAFLRFFSNTYSASMAVSDSQ
jgi:hypothetical protein